MLIAQDQLGRHLQVPDNPEPGQGHQDIIGEINLVPVEALSRAGLIGVVIVVPPLTHRDESEQPVVAGIVTGHIAPAAVNMCEGVDAERGVINQHGAPEEADHESWPFSNEEAQTGDRDRRKNLKFVQPHQLRTRCKIRNLNQIGCIVLSMEDPADMTIHKPSVPR